MRAIPCGMPHSMTGFGAARRVVGHTVVSIEVRSVNSKTCDVKVRLPRDLAHLEPKMLAAVRGRLHRGRVDMAVELADVAEATRRPRLNLPLARGYLAALRSLEELVEEKAERPVELLWAAPGVVEPPERDLGSAVEEGVDAALTEALDALQRTRAVEGAQLGVELGRWISALARFVEDVARAVPEANAQRRERLQARLRELVGEVGVDPIRLAQEVALLVDRADITEELARLDAHLAQLRVQLDTSEPSGRRLEFLLQEAHREINTIGSKAATADIAHRVVEAKTVLERLREQAQNIE